MTLPDEKTKRFIAVLNKKAPIGSLMNALGHATAGLVGGASDREQFCFLQYHDADGGLHPNISHYGFIILKADNSNKLRSLRQQAIEEGILYGDFTQSMTIGTSQEQQDDTAATAEADLEYYAVVLFGDSEQLAPLTRKFSLYS